MKVEKPSVTIKHINDQLPLPYKEKLAYQTEHQNEASGQSSGTKMVETYSESYWTISPEAGSFIPSVSCYAFPKASMPRWKEHFREMSAQDTRFQQMLKIRRTTLGFGVVQILLGVSLTALSFAAFAFTSSNRIRNACPYWAGFTVSSFLPHWIRIKSVASIAACWRDSNRQTWRFCVL